VRELADEARIRHFMQALGAAAREDGGCYLTGGATAVLLGWRRPRSMSTSSSSPSRTRCCGRCQGSRRSWRWTSPADFIPLPRAWRDRSLFVARERRLSFRHFDLCSQALAKLERGHTQDVDDVREMVSRGLVDEGSLRSSFAEIEPQLYRFPAIEPVDFRRSMEEFLGSLGR
jgi:hypothetical protein